MQVYLVGGAVRDELLGRAVTERDWVVVGATPEELQRQGYRPAGRDFPVFLHPETHEEYALARLERKVGPGYRGFVTESSPKVSLTEDLQRRDLTVNAMARAADGTLIDPFGGQADLQARVLRHVSPAFAEDPVRILRVARFAARFAPLNFHVAPATRELMRRMVEAGEADALVSERVWRELERALGEAQPVRFFEVLADCGALARVMPELTPLFGSPADTGARALPSAARGAEPNAKPSVGARALVLAADAQFPPVVRWAALVADLEAAAIDSLCKRLRTPQEYLELAQLAARLGAFMHAAPSRAGGASPEALTTNPDELLRLYELADAFRRAPRFQLWLQVLSARASASAAGARAADIALMIERLRAGRLTAGAVQLSDADLAAHRGPALAERLRALRLLALQGGLITAGGALSQ